MSASYMMFGVDPATREFPLTANEERPGEGRAVTTSRRRGRPKGSKNRPKPLVPATRDSPVMANDERSGEGGAVTSPRRRGRPKGSKNKAKALVPGTRESSNMLKCLPFEIPSGEDIRTTLETFARRRQLGLFILGGNGMVRNVTLHDPVAPIRMVTYAGPFQILSISGAFPRTTENQQATGITVSLKDVRAGAIVAGTVVGSLLAFGRVFVMVGTAADIHQELPNVQPAEV